jgi:hypothetical protein
MSNLVQVRENWLNGFIEGARPQFDKAGYPLPPNVRVSIGLPLAGYRSKSVGEICFPETSADGHYEIFINPKVSEGDATMAAILTRLLMYAATGSHGHQGAFKALAAALGMQGPLQTCTGGPDWFGWAAPILEELGPMDFAPLTVIKPRKVQTTWGIKVHCPDCGWLARVSAKHITAHDYLNCPAPTCGGIMIADLPEETEGE